MSGDRDVTIRLLAKNLTKPDFDQVTASLKGTKEATEGLSVNWRALGGAMASAISFAGVTRALSSTAEYVGQINDLAVKAGVTAEAFQELKFAAEQNGATFDQVSGAIAQMSNRLVEGDKGAVESLKAMGLSLGAIRDMAPDQAFQAIAAGIAQIEDPMQRTKVAMDLFGKSGADLLPVLTADLGALREEARAAGLVLGNDLVAQGDALGDALDKLTAMWEPLLARIIIPMVPAVEMLVGWIGRAVDVFSGLPTPVQAVTAGLGAVAAIVGPLVVGFSGISGVLGLVTSALPLLGTALTVLTGPIGIIAAAVVGLGVIWATWGEDIKRIAGEVYGAVQDWLVAKFDAIWSGITGALDTVRGAWVTLRDGVVTAVQFVFDNVKRILADLALLALAPILAPIALVLTTFQHWDRITAIAQAVYTGVKTWLLDKFTAIVDGIKGKIDAVTGFFKNMYDQVVGNSYVPEMMAKIQTEFARLATIMVQPAQEATGQVTDSFYTMSSNVQTSVGGLVRGLDDSFGGVLTKAGLFKGSFMKLFENLNIELSPTASALIDTISSIGREIFITWELAKSFLSWIGGGHSPERDERLIGYDADGNPVMGVGIEQDEYERRYEDPANAYAYGADPGNPFENGDMGAIGGFDRGTGGLRNFHPAGELVALHGREEVLTARQSEGVASMVARALEGFGIQLAALAAAPRSTVATGPIHITLELNRQVFGQVVVETATETLRRDRPAAGDMRFALAQR